MSLSRILNDGSSSENRNRECKQRPYKPLELYRLKLAVFWAMVPCNPYRSLPTFRSYLLSPSSDAAKAARTSHQTTFRRQPATFIFAAVRTTNHTYIALFVRSLQYFVHYVKPALECQNLRRFTGHKHSNWPERISIGLSFVLLNFQTSQKDFSEVRVSCHRLQPVKAYFSPNRLTVIKLSTKIG